jgi:GNAT superfamily N-acetyltransferase
MELEHPFVNIRRPNYPEKYVCNDLVLENWGAEMAERFDEQWMEYWKGGKYAPVFIVAVDDADKVIGFAAYRQSMLMKGAFSLIWIAIDKKHQGHHVGKALTEHRLAEIDEREGQMIQLVTQKPKYFSKFGFFKLHHLGNEWYLMLKLLTHKVDI